MLPSAVQRMKLQWGKEPEVIQCVNCRQKVTIVHKELLRSLHAEVLRANFERAKPAEISFFRRFQYGEETRRVDSTPCF